MEPANERTGYKMETVFWAMANGPLQTDTTTAPASYWRASAGKTSNIPYRTHTPRIGKISPNHVLVLSKFNVFAHSKLPQQSDNLQRIQKRLDNDHPSTH